MRIRKPEPEPEPELSEPEPETEPLADFAIQEGTNYDSENDILTVVIKNIAQRSTGYQATINVPEGKEGEHFDFRRIHELSTNPEDSVTIKEGVLERGDTIKIDGTTYYFKSPRY